MRNVTPKPTLAEALDQLGRCEPPASEYRARLCVCEYGLPGGDLMYAIALTREDPKASSPPYVGIPSSSFFSAKTATGAEMRLDVELLDQAVVDELGNVTLRDGRYIHGVRFEASYLTSKLAEADANIIHAFVHYIRKHGSEEMKTIAGAAYQAPFQELPNAHFLDFRALRQFSGLDLPLLKVLIGGINDELRVRGRPGYSKGQIAKALSQAGIRPLHQTPGNNG